MPDKNDFSEVIAEILIELQSQRKEISSLRQENRENNDRLIQTFNTGFTAIVEKITGLTDEVKSIKTELKNYASLDERIRQLQERVTHIEGK